MKKGKFETKVNETNLYLKFFSKIKTLDKEVFKFSLKLSLTFPNPRTFFSQTCCSRHDLPNHQFGKRQSQARKFAS